MRRAIDGISIFRLIRKEMSFPGAQNIEKMNKIKEVHYRKSGLKS